MPRRKKHPFRSLALPIDLPPISWPTIVRSNRHDRWPWTAGLVILFIVCSGFSPAWTQEIQTGPQTEARFPPLQVPDRFKATLFACDPLIEYPSVIAVGPKPNAIFVAFDYMTGLGTEIIRRSEVRLVQDTDADGYADSAALIADGFNSIQGLAYDDETIYVMHAPFLTALRKTNGTPHAFERRDLLNGLGLTPEQNPVRLHCANGVVVGHDGWLYLAIGDNGVKVDRPEGDQLVLNGGGILRCRRDGHDLHLFSTGLRNIYDVALDAELNVFVRDNENDGGTYKIRVCHSFYGAYHGYPHHYEEFPAEAIAPIADMGLGSSAGGVCYLEPNFPKEFRGNLFFCEWGKSVVRYPIERRQSGFAPVKELSFATGQEADKYGFKPTDVIVQADGSLIVSDWADGQRPKRGRGRIYRIDYTGAAREADRANDQGVASSSSKQDFSEHVGITSPDQALSQLASESYHVRRKAQRYLEQFGEGAIEPIRKLLGERNGGTLARSHAIWALTSLAGQAAGDTLFKIANSDSDVQVRCQAVRALADLYDPILQHHKLAAPVADPQIAERLAAMSHDLAGRELNTGRETSPARDPRLIQEIAVALGRLRWAGSVAWVQNNIRSADYALTHAAIQLLRRSDDWAGVLDLLDLKSDDISASTSTANPNELSAQTPITLLRSLALRAVAEQYDPRVVDGLIVRLSNAASATRRDEYAALLARVYRKPAAWTYWGYRPAPRPAHTLDWEKSNAIADVLNAELVRPNQNARLKLLERMKREKVDIRPTTLGNWLAGERNGGELAALLSALTAPLSNTFFEHLESIACDSRQSEANRMASIALYANSITATGDSSWLRLVQKIEDGPVLAHAVKSTPRFVKDAMTPLLDGYLASPNAGVRVAAIRTMTALKVNSLAPQIMNLLHDPNSAVRQEAVLAVTEFNVQNCSDRLLELSTDREVSVREACFKVLRALGERRAVPQALAALGDSAVERVALELVCDLGGPENAKSVFDVVRTSPSIELLGPAVRAFTNWQTLSNLGSAQGQELRELAAQVHGYHGVLVAWESRGPVPADAREEAIEDAIHPKQSLEQGSWKNSFASGSESRLRLAEKDAPSDSFWLARSQFSVKEPIVAEFSSSCSSPFQIWLDGKPVHENKTSNSYRQDADRFTAELSAGWHQVLVQANSPSAPSIVEFHLRFRRKSPRADHERLTQLALSRGGNVDRGRELFFNTDKTLCLKCHQLEKKGERIGPELTAVGSRFSRIHLIESILAPSQAIAPSFGASVVMLVDGRIVTGVIVAETESAITLADSQGSKHLIAKSDIEERATSSTSVMPEGLEKRLATDEEFLDLIAFLASLSK